MANKMYKLGKLESDIERLRSDCNWARLMDLSKQVTVKNSLHENNVQFLQVESKLERCLLEGKSGSPAYSTLQLTKLLPDLQNLTTLDLKKDHKEESTLLLAKLHFSLEQYSKPLDLYTQLDLPHIPTNEISSRKLRLIGEAFAIKGLCLERKALSSGNSRQNEEAIIDCFEKSGNISLYQLQERSKLYNTTLESDSVSLSPFVEQAIYRYPVLYIRRGDLQTGITKLRELLMVVESKVIQGLRVGLAKQLAEVLLRGVCGATYLAPQPYHPVAQYSSQNLPPLSPTPLKHSGDNIFIPKEKDEEALLLILISEAMATREVVLNRSSELLEARSHTINKAISIYDLLTICLAKKFNYNILTEAFEKATRFSFNEHHVWYQFALSLVCSEKYSRAYLVLKECMKLKGDDPTQKLLAAKLCYEQLDLIDEGIQHSQDALNICLGNALDQTQQQKTQQHQQQTQQQETTTNVLIASQKTMLLSRCHLHVGRGWLLKGGEVHMMKDRAQMMDSAHEAINTALSTDPTDHLNHFYMAYYLALVRKIPEALQRVRRALQLRRDHHHSLHLLTLLLTSQNLLPQASNLLDATLLEYPHDFSLLFSKSKLDLETGRLESALQVNKKMLLLWKDIFHAALSVSEDRGTGLLDRITGDQRSLLQLQFCEMADRDSGSTRAESVAASKMEQTLSEGVSSLGSNGAHRPGPQQAWTLQAQIWLSLAEVYMSSGKLDSARACIEEASSLCPMSHVLFYMKGQLEEAHGRCKTAQQFYDSAVSINPRHVKSLIRLGVLLHRLGNDRRAEVTLRKAVNTDHMCTASWRALGQVLQSLGDEREASECLSTALSLQTTNPILPFTIIHAQCG